MQYGTLLHIQNVQMLPDGRSLIETVGLSRFKVKSWGMHDGYTVGSIERVDDISLAEEERLEALDTSQTVHPSLATTNPPVNLDILPTTLLLRIGLRFIEKMHATSAPWLHERVLQIYGNPPQDPALFPYWFASVLPIAEGEKYKLLPTRSVRERLKLCARWVRGIESQRWYVSYNALRAD
jgi:Lon protease-like protein